MGFTREELARFEGETVDDLLGPEVRLLFVGINPGLWTAATNTHFCHPSNRFYPALRAAGLIDWGIDTSAGMSVEERERLARTGIGITNLVPRATARASQLTAGELRQGASRLERLVSAVAPRVIAVAGVTAYRTAFGRRGAVLGPQPERIGEAEVWVVPNPSGLNAHETIGSLADWYRKAAKAAGLQ
ncbi:MAG: mismatch-specific DNA-glycosylase [Acidimicrobiia bacterium]